MARYASSGELEGVYELPLEGTPVTRRFVTISGDGDVYFLRTRIDGTDVVGVGFRPLSNTSVIDLRPPPPQKNIFQKIFDAIAAMRPSNRQQTIETAFAFEGLQWKLTPANYGADPDMACSGFSRIRRPWYLQGKVNQEVRGVPYCWGCHGSLANFQQRVEAGAKAGNVCTRNAPRSDVAGVDCSAFVSAAWGLSVHYTTAAIPSIAKTVENPWDLKPGDALNKPGSHVMLFLRFTPDRKAEVMESSTGGCNGRVCRNVYPLASLLQRGYVPVRFRGLADGRDDRLGKRLSGSRDPGRAFEETRHREAGRADEFEFNEVMAMPGFFKTTLVLAAIAASSIRFDGARAASSLQLSNPDGGEVRALVIGIDDYQHVRKLKGATADARDHRIRA